MLVQVINAFIVLLAISLEGFGINPPTQQSQCYGTIAQGSIKNAVQLPTKGKNFIIYHVAGDFLGRNYVHSKVYAVILETFQKLYQQHPLLKFKYAETGLKNGGEFKPHKTHQNGLSVDFMVPVIDKTGNSVYFATDFSNKFGYGVEFDNDGKYKNYRIDFEAMTQHLVLLNKTAHAHGIAIRRIIFDQALQKKLFQTAAGTYLRKNLKFMPHKAWVRHDEHYHIDFEVPCKVAKS